MDSGHQNSRKSGSFVPYGVFLFMCRMLLGTGRGNGGGGDHVCVRVNVDISSLA